MGRPEVCPWNGAAEKGPASVKEADGSGEEQRQDVPLNSDAQKLIFLSLEVSP